MTTVAQSADHRSHAQVDPGRRDSRRSLRLLPAGIADPSSFAEHLARYGPVPAVRGQGDCAEVIDAIEASGLTGRGGAGFPTATKLRAVAERGRAIVVANGTEGEPASAKDKTLLVRNPHLVIDGAMIAADAVGADEIIVAVGDGVPAVRHALERALAARAKATTRHTVTLVAVPERFVSGEESALVHFLNGGPALPTSVPPRPFERGVRGAPTLVQNVETLASLALIARGGAEWFRGRGTDGEPGSVLVTVLGAVRRPGVLELPLGTPLPDLLDRFGGVSAPTQALLAGGYFGTWVSAEHVESLTLSDASLSSVGASLGACTFAVFPQGRCGVTETARIARYLADESAAQCGPCLFGLRALADTVEAIASGKAGIAEVTTRLPRLTAQIARRGACAHPDGAVRFVKSAVRVFGAEIARHLEGRCHAPGTAPLLPIPSGRSRHGSR
jgi:NADH:ubiquinone oxidoreductase subunit F (NADH-binding)